MPALQNKIDFAVILTVNHANPNGDPSNGNRPRTDYSGYGEISDVCLKRKLRDRMQDEGQEIFVQSDDRKTDGMKSLKERAEHETYGLGKDAFNPKKKSKEETAKLACAKWLDVRSFGQLFAFGKEGDAAGVSIPIRGPVTLQSAFSVEPISIASLQITKSVSGEGDGTKRSSDTMGMNGIAQEPSPQTLRERCLLRPPGRQHGCLKSHLVAAQLQIRAVFLRKSPRQSESEHRRDICNKARRDSQPESGRNRWILTSMRMIC